MLSRPFVTKILYVSSQKNLIKSSVSAPSPPCVRPWDEVRRAQIFEILEAAVWRFNAGAFQHLHTLWRLKLVIIIHTVYFFDGLLGVPGVGPGSEAKPLSGLLGVIRGQCRIVLLLVHSQRLKLNVIAVDPGGPDGVIVVAGGWENKMMMPSTIAVLMLSAPKHNHLHPTGFVVCGQLLAEISELTVSGFSIFWKTAVIIGNGANHIARPKIGRKH